MPSDSNGVYSLPGGYLAVTGEIIQASQHNPPLEDLGASMSQRVMRSGATPMTGPLKGVDGTASAPGLTFNSATGTGLYKTTDGVGVSVNGAQVAEFTAAFNAKYGRIIGELIPYTGKTAPPRCVLPAGQTLSRTDYADLWAFAQTEIAAGNLFYNNGNGTTTFGIGDLRGRSISCPDNMGGGTDPARLAAGALAGVRNSLGGAGGESTHALPAAEIPDITSRNLTQAMSMGASVPSIPIGNTWALAQNPNSPSAVNSPVIGGGTGISTFSGWTQAVQVVSLNTGGAGPVHNNMQPTLLCHYALYAGA